MDCSHESCSKERSIRINNMYTKGGIVEIGPFTLVVDYLKCKTCGKELTRTNIIEEASYQEEYFVSDRENIVRSGYSYCRKRNGFLGKK